MKLVICGEGGLGHEVLDLALQIQNESNENYEEILFLDDNDAKKGYMGYRTLPSWEIYKNYSCTDTKFVMAIGEPLNRIKLIKEVKDHGYEFATLIHPTASIGLNAKIAAGTVVQRGVLVSCDCTIGENCFLQAYSTVGHDTVMGDNCTISTNVAISGGVTIGDNTYLAVGTSVIQGAKIGSNSVLGMGSVVLRDIPDNVIAMGNPARPMKNKDSERVFK